jgi:hypothetical protein
MKHCFQKNFRFEMRRKGSRVRRRTRYTAGKKNQTELFAGSVDLNERNIQIIREEQRLMEADEHIWT